MSAIRLRARGPGGGAVLNGVRSDWTLQQLKALVETELQVPAAQQGLRAGFPPALIPDVPVTTLAELGIRDGDTILVEKNAPQAMAPDTPAAAEPVVAPDTATTPIATANASGVQQLRAMGFGAAEATGALSATGDDVQAAVQILLGGGDVPAQPAGVAAPAAGGAAPTAGAVAAAAAQQRSRAYSTKGVTVDGVGGSLHRRVVPADNSCLFNSVGYVCEGDRQLSSSVRLRKLVADNVLADPVQYSDVILGKPTQ